MFKGYTVKDNDTFNIQDYPDVESEVAVFSKRLDNVQAHHKTEIVISFLKDHCITTEWLPQNEVLVKMMTSGALSTRQTETLFNACKHNRGFLAGFEKYISSMLRPASS